MQSLPNYVTKRVSSGIYHFRIRVPVKIQRMTGKKEIHHSLKTREPRQAIILASAILEAVESLFRQVQGDCSEMDKKSVLARLGIDGDITELVKIGDITIDRPELSALEEIQLAKDLAKELGSTLQAPTPAPQIVQAPQLAGITLSELYEKFKVQKAGAWSKKTLATYDKQYNLLFELLGNVDISKLNRSVANGLLNILKEYPANANKLPKFRDKKPLEIYGLNAGAKRDKAPVLDPHTVNIYMQRMVTLFDYAVINEYAPKNHFIKLFLEESDKEEESRRPFTEAELKEIFSSDVFTKKKKATPYQYWLPVLGLYTGARLNELCGLALEDVQEINEINFIFFRDRKADGHSLKNKASIRKTPISQKLIDLGFLEYCNERRKNGKFYLFDLNQDEYGSFIKSPSSWFNRFLTKIKLKEDGLCFHSLRHTLQIKLQMSALSAELRSAYMGHSLGDGAEKDGGSRTTINTYGTSYTPELLSEKVLPFVVFDVEIPLYV